MNQTDKDAVWMKVAHEEARLAMLSGEVPIGVVIVGGDCELIRSQTSVFRRESKVAHGELLALTALGWSFRWAERPLRMYSTVEPCWMCTGAALQCDIDEIIFAMPAESDGGTRYLDVLAKAGQKIPQMRGGVLYEEAVEMMRFALANNDAIDGADYITALLNGLPQSRMDESYRCGRVQGPADSAITEVTDD